MGRIRLRRKPVSMFAPAPRFAAPSPASASAPVPSQPPRVWYAPDPDEIGSPQAWLYVSKRLDFEWVPYSDTLWSAPVITFGSTENPTAFYRLTARVLVWLEAAGEQLEMAYHAGTLARDQLDVYFDSMLTVWAFVNANLALQAIASARLVKEVLTLPESA